ncbi:hypothetical protein NPIL_377811 [Nephila pilipes]|uniref:Uncharacterized protein n=1 Tax=Nephila pilipes TaxID=299642 RepID=A0A8X6N7W8_NEPPI|nr:hypothetical protein NPIL_102751 [Nephila pilipes]GFT92411.1 hypothetical protein NPIL_377811 [Nephila pilipes]
MYKSIFGARRRKILAGPFSNAPPTPPVAIRTNLRNILWSVAGVIHLKSSVIGFLDFVILSCHRLGCDVFVLLKNKTHAHFKTVFVAIPLLKYTRFEILM